MEQLFERSYGHRRGIDESSKELLKRDVFVQGLLLRWQKKVLPSASTFADALHQARAAEQQELQLAKMHPTTPRVPFKPKAVPDRKAPPSDPPRDDKPPSRTRRELKCFECGHKWRDCPLRKPTETPGRPKDTSTRAITTVAETLDERCNRLQQEWFDAEFVRMSKGYEGVIQAVGPLCYAKVEIAGQLVDTMVDTGSFELFKKIGKEAKIPVSALSKPDIVLRDYNKRLIPVGAKVELPFRFASQTVTAPVYIRTSGSDETETCLLGTNIIFPLQLMQPAKGVCHEEERQARTGYVCRAQARRIPGVCLKIHADGPRHSDAPLLFEPDRDWTEKNKLELASLALRMALSGSSYGTQITRHFMSQRICS